MAGLGTLDYLTVVTNPHSKVGRKRKALKARSARKRRTPAQKAATARMLRSRGMSRAKAYKAAGYKPPKRKAAKKAKRRAPARRKTTTRKKTARKTVKRPNPRRTTMARKRRQTAKQRAASLRNLRKARKKLRSKGRKRANTHRKPRRKARRKKTRKRRNPTMGQAMSRSMSRSKRSAAARKGARTKAANKRKRQAAGRKAARTRKRPARKRNGRRRGTARTMSVIRSRSRTARSKTRGLRSLRRTRRYLKGRRKSGSLTKAYASRHRMRTNRRRRSYRRRYSYRRNQPATAKMSVKGFYDLLPKFGAGLGGMLVTAFIGGYIGPYIPVGGAYAPVIVSTASLAATWYLTDKVKMLKKYQLPILIGAGIGWSITFLRTFFPSFAMSLGIMPAMVPAGNGMEGYWAEGIAPIGPRGLSDYVRSGVLEGFVPSGTPTLGAYVEEPLSGLGAAYQAVGMGIDVEEAIAGWGGMGNTNPMTRPWGSLQMGGLGLDAVPVAQSGCANCNMGTIMPMSAVPRNLPVNVRMAALQKAGQVTRDIAVRPPREMLGVQSCGIFGSTIWE